MNPVSTASSRRTLLNPNAREFVPISLRSSSAATILSTGDETEPSTTSDNGKTISDKTVSSDTCTSDEESRRYWNAQLPDDIFAPDTDFFAPAVEEGIESGSRVLTSESSAIENPSDSVADNLSWEVTAKNGLLQPGPAHVSADDYSIGHNVSRHLLGEEELGLSSSAPSSRTGNWNSPMPGRGNRSLHSSSLLQIALKESNALDSLKLLFNEFPSVPEQSLAAVYEANGGDLGSTIRMLHQLQGETSLRHNVASPGCFSPNSRLLGLSATSTPEIARGGSHFVDDSDGRFADVTRSMRKNNSQWHFDGRGSGELSLGPANVASMNSYSNLFEGELNDERSDVSILRQKHWLSPRDWVESDDALENVLLELREAARNHGRICNFYFEQARQAISVGNRMLAKEASAKEQFHNRLMKAAQAKAAELESKRSMFASQSPSFGPGQTQLLDLRGRHVNEAIHILKRDLAALRLAARSSRQRQQVFISVGTGHQKGARTPARLLFAIKRYLTEEELLNFTEVQPGILKVVVS